MSEIIHKDLCYELGGFFYEIQNKLGNACSERQYQDALEFKLKNSGCNYEREKDLLFKLKEGNISGNRADFVIDDKIVIDIKAKKYITREDYKQMLRYLKSGNYKLGLIVNFGERKVIIKRIVNSDIRI